MIQCGETKRETMWHDPATAPDCGEARQISSGQIYLPTDLGPGAYEVCDFSRAVCVDVTLKEA